MNLTMRSGDKQAEVFVVRTPDSERIRAAEVMLALISAQETGAGDSESQTKRNFVYDELAKILKGNKE